MSNWNGKVRCITSDMGVWKAGKIYKVVNGRVEKENGMSCHDYNDINNLNSLMDSQFEEVLDIPQPHKSLLKSGMKVVYRDGSERYVFLPANKLLFDCGSVATSLLLFSDSLLVDKYKNDCDIMEIYTEDGELIAKREEKSTKDTKIEELEKRMRELADEIAELKGE